MAKVRNPRASAKDALPIATAPVRSPRAFAVPLPSTNAKLSGVLVQPEPMEKKPPRDKHDAVAAPAPPTAAAANPSPTPTPPQPAIDRPSVCPSSHPVACSLVRLPRREMWMDKRYSYVRAQQIGS